MGRILRPLLGLTLVLLLQMLWTQATGRPLSHPPQLLPPCSQVPGGISGWDCYDPPHHQLPPCDFHHQRIGFDCSGWPPVSRAGDASPTTFKSKTRPLLERRTAIDLPPCSHNSDDDTDSWTCSGASKRPLPPCDIINHRIGHDCSGWPKWPPAGGSEAGEAPPATVKEGERTEAKGGRVEAELPPCSEVPGGMPGWNCYDPPTHPLPPCDFRHQRIGFDCSGWPPAGAP